MSFATNDNKKPVLTLNTEIRHLSSRDRLKLCQILDIGDAWKELAAIIPKPDATDGYLITNNNILVLEQQKHIPGGSAAQALLDYWGTSGRKRATLEDLILLLNACHLYRASNFICNELLNINCSDVISKNCGSKNSNYCDIKCDRISDDLNNLSTKLMVSTLSSESSISSEQNGSLTPTAPNESQLASNHISNQSCNEHRLLDESVLNIRFEQLVVATTNFCDEPLSKGGCKIGEGAFGSVYRCKLSFDDKYFAVKKLKKQFEKQFLAELSVMNKFKHPNLLSVRAMCCDGPSFCIVYEYMSNGSLLDCLSCVNNNEPIQWLKRISICLDIARGICHLHTFGEKPCVHRDIKSANILLDEKLNARVGDFGLVRVGSSGSSTSTNQLATTIIGTSVYMAPEAFRGDISVKLDTFSFGVVLLEILTGLSPYDETRDEPDLLSYLEEKMNDYEDDQCNAVINSLVDTSAGVWNLSIANELYQLSQKCTEQRKKYRPTMVEVLQSLEKMSSLIT